MIPPVMDPPSLGVSGRCQIDRANGCAPSLALRAKGPDLWRPSHRRRSQKATGATGGASDLLSPLRDLPGRLFPRPESLELVFRRPETLFPGSSLRDWVLQKEAVLQDFEWEAVILVCVVALVLADASTRWGSKDTGEQVVRTEDDLERSRKALMRQTEGMYEDTRGLTWLAGVTLAVLWIGGIMNHDNALQP